MKSKNKLIFLVQLILIITLFNCRESEKKLAINFIDEEIPFQDQPEQLEQYHHLIRTRDVFLENRSYGINYKIDELKKTRRISEANTQRVSTSQWIERGPGNVPGRTRSLLNFDSDPNGETWLAGSAGGGIWKTTDGGKTWDWKSESFPNMATTVLAYSKSNESVIYAGTGEFFNNVGGIDGNGIFKSTNGGQSWAQISATASDPDFRNVFKIIVDPNDPNILLAAVSQSSTKVFQEDLKATIFKSIDGGTSWSEKFTSNRRIQDMDFRPDNFSIQYATINGTGLVKSIDAGETWTVIGTDIITSGRIEMDISPADPDRIFISVQGGTSGGFGVANPTGSNDSDVYVSLNAGDSWQILIEENGGINHNHLDGQGGYDNTIMAHPFDPDILYVGGVDLWKMEIGDLSVAVPAIGSVDTTNVGFIEFVNFGASFFGGRMEIGSNNEATQLDENSYVDVEILFGPGIKQKAHRFSIKESSGSNGDDGAGVPTSGYLYQDYVEVPFQVWDRTNNKQLMASFRDQENDGAWNLEERNNADATIAREYLFVNGIEYSETPNANISNDAGHSYKQIYFMWPALAGGYSFVANELPNSSIEIFKSEVQSRYRKTFNISDSRGQYAGNNANTQQEGIKEQTELHPDHHQLLPIVVDNENKTFKILNANDGGVFVSNTSTLPGVNNGEWTHVGKGYNTSQLYGVDKAPGKNEYICGMQDNASWRSPRAEDASSASDYLRANFGDGFEALWHYSDVNKIITSSQNNGFRKTTDGGKSWGSATSGLFDPSSPFVSKLSSSKNDPDRIYTVASQGVWSSSDFGDNWELAAVSEDWEDFGFVMDVTVSQADHMIVWAGGGMTTQSKLHVSLDSGNTFNAVENYEHFDLLGRISGIETHPTEPKTAFALFSFPNSPKVLRTNDLGKTWVDISGFEENLTSSNGFPDVAVYALVVMPYNTNIIWVGTEIGIMESVDGGQNWHALGNGFPALSVWELKIVDDQVIAATHGRGIWTLDLDEINNVPFIVSNDRIMGIPPKLKVNARADYDSLEVYIDGDLDVIIANPDVAVLDIATSLNTSGSHQFQIVSYINDKSYSSSLVTLDVLYEEVLIASNIGEERSLYVYPNPSASGELSHVSLENYNGNTQIMVRVYSLSGNMLDQTLLDQKGNFTFDKMLNSGIYVLHFMDGERRLGVEKWIIK
ncbi:T9SS type A sorting domain-containing protein [Reichenbachiella sp.]|uniref:T9SS type A sorting domain-containing protein n=1 Tax=Reichenbachiella sp. TaxID=2184521 RepID=UPI003B58CC3B